MEKIPEFIANHLFLFSLLVGILALLLWNMFGSSFSGVTELTPMEATRKMNHEKAIVLDMRPAEEFTGGHILNALNIPVEKLSERQNELGKYKDRPLILCSRIEIESARAARILKSQGFDQIYSLKGGLQTWRGANLPLVRDETKEKTA